MNKKILLLLTVICLLFIAFPVFARIVPECMSGQAKGACGLCDFFLLINNIFQFIAFKLAPPLAGLMFLAAGALFLTSGGSEDRVSQAKKIFINVLLGAVAIYASWLIVNSVIQIIGKSTDGFNKETWYQFNCNSTNQ